MLIFTNNVPIYILENPNGKISTVNEIIFSKRNLNLELLKGNLLIRNIKFSEIINLIKDIQKLKSPELDSIQILVKDEFKFKNKIKSKIQVIKAAGGVVENHKEEILLMKRLGFWDLPKGKADAGESSKITAQREVEEECNVEVIVKNRICTTWHTYFIKDKLVIKRTKWYKMVLISDKKMKPQKEEGIEELNWCDTRQLTEYLKKSYRSISFVVENFLEK